MQACDWSGLQLDVDEPMWQDNSMPNMQHMLHLHCHHHMRVQPHILVLSHQEQICCLQQTCYQTGLLCWYNERMC